MGGRLVIDALEHRRMLTVLSNATTLPAQLSTLVTNGANVASEVNAIHDKLFAATNKLPLIGSAIANASGGATDSLVTLGTRIATNALGTLSGSITGTSIQNKFAAIFGTSGFNILPNANLSVVLEDTTGSSSVPNQVDINLEFTGTLFTSALHPNFDLGLPGVGLNVNGTIQANLTYDVQIKLVVNTSQGFFVNLAPNPEASLTLAVTAPGLSATGTLGFFQLSATDGTAAGNTKLVGTIGLDLSVGGANQLTPSTLGSLIGNSTLSANAEADVHLHTILSFGGNTNFPNFAADFDLTWNLANASLGADATGKLGVTSSVFGNKPDIKFNNIQLDLGTFFSNFLKPVVQKVQNALAPVQPLIDLLNKTAPVFNDLHLADLNGDGTTTVLEALESFVGLGSPQAVKFIDTIVAANAFINSIPTSGVSIMLPLGSFEVGGGSTSSSTSDLRGANASLATATETSETPMNTTSELQSSGNSSVTAFLTALQSPALAGGPKPEDGAGFKIPLLQKPAMVFDLLLGKDVDLFTFDTPTLEFNPTISFAVAPIEFLPFLKVKFSGGADFKAHLSMGYDTAGLLKFKADNFQASSALDLLDGFYVIDDPAKTFASASLTLSVGLGLDIGIASAYVVGGITGTVTFTVDDPNRTTDGGKFRASAIASVLATTSNPLSLFNINGTISASLDLQAQVLAIPYEYNIATIQLASFAISHSTAPVPPSLGSVDASGNLNLNIGNGAQNFYVSSGGVSGGNETVYVSANGLSQTFTGVKMIKGVCGNGNDIITVQASSPVSITGGAGNETIQIGRNENATLVGGPGNDYLGSISPTIPSTGSLRLFGNGGNDTLVAGGGSDSLSGGDQDDILYGGGGTDTLTAGNGNDTLSGGLNNGAGFESLIGGTGTDTFLADNSTGALGGPQFLQPGSGKNLLQYDNSDTVGTFGPFDTAIKQGVTIRQNGIPITPPVLLPSKVILPTLTVNYSGSSQFSPYFAASSAVDSSTNQPLAGFSNKPSLTFAGPFGKGDPVDAGTYTVTGYAYGDTLHATSTATVVGALVINTINPVITSTNTAASFDGKPHAASVFAAGPSGQNVSSQLVLTYKNLADNSISALPPSQTGSYEVFASFTGSRNYNAVANFDTGKTITISTIFNSPTTLLTDSNLFGTLVADFNADGIPDLMTEDLTTSAGVTATLNVALGNGNGTFRAPVSTVVPLMSFQYILISNGPLARQAFVADVNHDGKVDLVSETLSAQTGGVSGLEILKGNGDGTFQTPLFANAANLDNISPADFNGDGNLDFVFNNFYSGGVYGNTLSIFLGQSSGPVLFTNGTINVGVAPRGNAVGDFNGDGKIDIIICDSNGTSILLGNGNGTFGAETTFATQSTPHVEAADINRDGKLDVVLSDSSGIAVYLGNGNGTFQSPKFLPLTVTGAGLIPPIRIGDYNGDGNPDIATYVAPANSFSATSVQILYGHGDGTFDEPLAVVSSVFGLFAADLNLDGVSDLVIADGSSHVLELLNNAPKLAAAIAVNDVAVTYDGQSHAASFLATGANGLNVAVLVQISYLNTVTQAVTTSAPTQAGTYDVLVSFAGNTRYNAVSTYDSHKTITINPANVGLAFTNVSVPTDGVPHESIAAATGVQGENLNSLLQLQYQNTADSSISLTPPRFPGTFKVFATFQGNSNYKYVPLFDTGKTVVIAPGQPRPPRSTTAIISDGFTNLGGPYSPTPYVNGAALVGNRPGIANLPDATYNYFATNPAYLGGTIATGVGNPGASVTVGPQSNITASLKSTSVYAEPTFITLSVDLRMNTIAGTDLLSRGIGLGFAASAPTGFNGPNPINNGVIVNAATGNLYFSSSNGATITAIPGGTYNAGLLGAWNPGRFYTLTYTVLIASGDVINLSFGNSTGVETIAAPGTLAGFVGGVGAANSTANFVDVSSNGNDGGAVGYVDNLSVSIATAPLTSTSGPSAITTGGATLNGSVNAQNGSSSAFFQYSTDPTFAPSISTTIGSGLSQPKGVAVDAAGDLFVANTGSNNIKEILPNGTIATIGSGFSSPYAVAVDSIGDIYVADFGNNAVKEILRNGTIITLGSGFSGPAGVAVDSAGNVYVSDSGHNAVKKILPNGTIVTVGSGFSLPQGLAVDSAGDLIVADYGNNVVKEVLPSGTILTFDYGFAGPVGVAIDGVGNIVVADTSNNLVREVSPDGTIRTLASGFSLPIGVAIDVTGNVFVGDFGSGRAIKLSSPLVAATPAFQSGASPTPISFALSGLTGQTAYYYRSIAQGVGGTTVGVTNGFVPTPVAGSGLASVSVGALNLGAGASFTLGTAAAAGDRTVLVADSLSIDTAAQLNLGGNDLIVHSTGTTTQTQTLAAINALLKTGYGTGTWAGAGIASSAAQANATRGLGVKAITTSGTFDGQPVTTSDVVVAYTFNGDTNLDGSVTFEDLLTLAKQYGKSNTDWSTGDFNYDGRTDFNDLLALAKNYNQTSITHAAPATTLLPTRTRAVATPIVVQPVGSATAASAIGRTAASSVQPGEINESAHVVGGRTQRKNGRLVDDIL